MILEILRRKSPADAPWWQRFSYEPQGGGETVATALTRLSQRPALYDIQGQRAAPIEWDRSCLQKKCGACAMVINGVPRLACDALLADLGERVRLEPLKKFPVAADLVVDRGVMMENLKTLGVWLEETAQLGGQDSYEASRCLQCGLCLEVCPNFYAGGPFFGAAAAVPVSRVIAELSRDGQKGLRRRYEKYVYAGCGKSLACQNICPAGIPVEGLMSGSNGAMVWRLWRRRKAKEDQA